MKSKNVPPEVEQGILSRHFAALARKSHAVQRAKTTPEQRLERAWKAAYFSTKRYSAARAVQKVRDRFPGRGDQLIAVWEASKKSRP